MNRTWSPSDIEYLKANWPTGDKVAIAKHLGKTPAAVKSKAGVIGIKREINKKHYYTLQEDKYILDNYANTRSDVMAQHLNISISSLYNRAQYFGLKKSKEYIISEAKRIGVSDAAKKHWFPKGHIPVNKGQKMSPELYKKCAPTMFKKGNKPHNTKADGEISIRKDKNGHEYQYIRVSLGKWELLHRHIWEKANGPIPENHNVVFIDKNHLNCELSNLELISNEELMERNTIQRYPKELQTTIKAVSKLTKHIQHHEK